MKQPQKLHPFMDHLKKAKKQNVEFCEWLAMAEEAFNDGNAERAFEYALRAYEKTKRTTLICRMMPAYFGRPNAFPMKEENYIMKTMKLGRLLYRLMGYLRGMIVIACSILAIPC